jgi:ribonuclease Z
VKTYVDKMKKVQASSHTPQGAFGYLLGQIDPRPRITVATHFNVADDTVACALKSVRQHVPDIVWDPTYDKRHKNVTWSFDLMVIRLFANDPERVEQRQAVVNEFCFSPPADMAVAPEGFNSPKYADSQDQIDKTTAIEPGDDTYCDDGY